MEKDKIQVSKFENTGRLEFSRVKNSKSTKFKMGIKGWHSDVFMLYKDLILLFKQPCFQMVVDSSSLLYRFFQIFNLH